MGRFFNELEDWLSAFAKFNDSNNKGEGTNALASGMSEEAARALLSLSRAIAAGGGRAAARGGGRAADHHRRADKALKHCGHRVFEKVVQFHFEFHKVENTQSFIKPW
mgnify:CR=1 FL=1